MDIRPLELVAARTKAWLADNGWRRSLVAAFKGDRLIGFATCSTAHDTVLARAAEKMPNGALQWQPPRSRCRSTKTRSRCGRSRDARRYPDLVPVWHAFRDARARRRSVQWLPGEGPVSNGSVGHFLSDHPDPSLP